MFTPSAPCAHVLVGTSTWSGLADGTPCSPNGTAAFRDPRYTPPHHCLHAPRVNTASTLFAPPPSRTSTTQPLTWPPARVTSAGGVFIGAVGKVGPTPYEEGISTDVSGMVPGSKYALSFYQANAGLEGGTYGTPLGSTSRWEVKSRHGLSPPRIGTCPEHASSRATY